MNSIRPALFQWRQVDVCVDGGEVRRLKVMVPHPRFVALCDRQFVDEEDYALEPVVGRSMKSHSHFFACVHEAFMNLPEQWAKLFPTETHMRKYVLCKTGFANEANYILDTSKDAKIFARALRGADEFSVIKVTGSAVTVWTAKSQNMRSMRKEEFQASKTAVLDFLAEIIGVARGEIEEAGAQHAPRRVGNATRQLTYQKQGEQDGDDAGKTG